MLIAQWIAHYNEERLHAGLGYLTPADYYRGNPAARQAERRRKLETARQARQQRNTERLRRAAQRRPEKCNFQKHPKGSEGSEALHQRDSPPADIYRVAVDGLSPPELVWHDDHYKWPLDVSPDAETLVDATYAFNRHVLTLRALTKKGAARVLADGQALYDPDARFSPNGRWVAFSVSPAEGRLYERYVQATAGGPRRQLSIGGGTRPRWTHGGRDLVYVAADSIMAIAVDPETGAAQKPRLLLRDARVQQTLSLEVAPDGDHFLMVLPVDNPKAAPITVVLNWFTELRSLMKAK